MEQEYLSRSKLEENASRYADSTAGQARTREDYLVFILNGERVAIELKSLDEISEVPNGISLPQTHRSILGLISLRGETVLLFDLASLTGNSAITEPQPQHRVLVFDDGTQQRWAFLVERIEGVVALETESFQQAQERESKTDLRTDLVGAVAEHEDKSLALINIDTLVQLAHECL